MTKILPPNGTKTHPLSEHAKDILRRLAIDGPRPRDQINPGVINRLMREGLIQEVMLRSPYKTHKGALLQHFEITAKGFTVIAM